MGEGVGHREHVVGADSRGQERLVGVAQRRVGDEEALLPRRPAGEFLGPEPSPELVAWLPRGGAPPVRRAGGRARAGSSSARGP